MAETFAGFDSDLVGFLTELGENNHRVWFNANKARYEASVREPARAFVRAIGPRIAAISPYFLADDRKVGGSLMRVYRDTRFSRDKTPYKTNVGIQFRHEAGKDVHAPGFYVHVEPGAVFIAVGVWRPDARALRAIRAKIDEAPDRWVSIIEARRFRRFFEQGGASLKNPPRGYAKDHPLVHELERTDHIAVHEMAPEEVLAPAFPDRVIERFRAAGDFVRFVCEAVGVRY